MRIREIYGREFVKRHLQELDRARAAELVAVKQKLDSSFPPEDQAEDSKPLESRSRCHVEQSRKPQTSASRQPDAIPPRKSSNPRQAPLATAIATAEAVAETNPKNAETLVQELKVILTSASAVAKPTAALDRGLAHHRRHISASSVYSFNALLAYASAISNYHGIRKILSDMQRQNVQWNKMTRIIVTKVTLRGTTGRASRMESREADDGLTANEVTTTDIRKAGPWTGGIDNSLSGLTCRVDASRISITEAERSILLNGGYWKSEKSSLQKAATSGTTTSIDHATSDHSPSSRTSILEGALSPAEARSHLPQLDKQLSPTLFLAFLRYILACNPQPPSLAESYMALLALNGEGQSITCDHIRHLAHLYLHPSLYAAFRPLWVVREMRRLTKEGSIVFVPTSQTLEKALLSLRLRWNRHRRAHELVEYFSRKWGDVIVSVTCWRLLGRYALEAKNHKLQLFATQGGDAVLARQINRSRNLAASADSSIGVATPLGATKEELFPKYGLERRKWGRVRQAIRRCQRRARRNLADVGAP
ncbi:hypothetical protein NliqN6_5328 [Naganishia liquefaciens]|uniref:Uncharacterized protein n=1 Tax=Naganishia liquefaciens TaxID=104408 RepID=A0A8H3TXW3_9TREE|nr:hypothetical protein NliqN6_5328 [Naganishia liquefaciens]